MKAHGLVTRDNWGLRGPVQTCRLEQAWCSPPGQTDTTILEFRRDGACRRHWNRDPRGLEWIRLYRYDDLDRLVVTRATGPHGWTHARMCEYDSAGRISRVVARDAGGRERIADSYSYAAGRLEIHTRYLETETCAHTFWDVEGTDAFFPSCGAVAITTFFDARERPTTTLFLNQRGEILNRVLLRYDEAGNVIEEEAMPDPEEAGRRPEDIVIPGLAGQPQRRFFRHDHHGRRIEIIIPHRLLGECRTSTIYNEQGDESFKTSLDLDRAYEVNADGCVAKIPFREVVRQCSTRIHYQYDVRGNWLERVVHGRSGADTEWVVETIVHRTLTYF